MPEENKTVELKDEQLEKVTGGGNYIDAEQIQIKPTRDAMAVKERLIKDKEDKIVLKPDEGDLGEVTIFVNPGK